MTDRTEWDADYREIEAILNRMERDVSENLKGNSLRSKLRIAGQPVSFQSFPALYINRNHLVQTIGT